MLIDSPANPTVKTLRALATAKGRRESRLFPVEGIRAIEDGLRAGHSPAIVLYNWDLLSRTTRGQALITSLAAANSDRLHEGSPRALAAAAETQHPQGIIAAFPIIDWGVPSSPAGPALALICDAVQDPGNVGTLLRAAEAAGVNAVFLTPDCAEVYSPKVVRSAMGAHFRLPFYEEMQWPAIVASLGTLGIPPTRCFATDADARSPYFAVDWVAPSAIAVSNEAHGLSLAARAALAGDSSLISIPMAGGTDSLNAALAGAIVLFEAARQRVLASGAATLREDLSGGSIE